MNWEKARKCEKLNLTLDISRFCEVISAMTWEWWLLEWTHSKGINQSDSPCSESGSALGENKDFYRIVALEYQTFYVSTKCATTILLYSKINVPTLIPLDIILPSYNVRGLTAILFTLVTIFIDLFQNNVDGIKLSI